MFRHNFRPWGLLNWVLDRLPDDHPWDLIGCLSTEERCLGTLNELHLRGKLASLRFLRISDPPSKFTDRANELFVENTLRFKAIVGNSDDIQDHELFEPYGLYIESVKEFLSVSDGNIILDISSFPKRFFFPILKILMESTSLINNLLVTYAIPDSYSSGYLAEDPEEIRTLPLFDYASYPLVDIKMAFVGIGFLTLGLPELLHQYKDLSVKYFFPFPPGPPAYHRNLEFIHQINQEFPIIGHSKHKLYNINAHDASDAFDYICAQTTNSQFKAIFAPYGPKPISLAMCIYAILTKSAVYYTQPRAYNPEYSKGIKIVNGLPEIYTYCLRLDGRDLYQINT